MDTPRPPRHLSAESKRLFREILDAYILEGHHIKILQSACEALDRMRQAQREIKERGLLIEGRFGAKLNPAVTVERDSRANFYRGLRELGLDIPETPRELPRVSGRGR